MLVWVAPLLSGVLLYACYFPLGQSWLAWFALIPWLALVRLPHSAGRLYLASWVGGLVFFVPVLQWARVADARMYVTWLFLAVVCAFFWTAILAGVRCLVRRGCVPLVLAFPLVVVGADWFRWGCLGGFYSLVSGSHQHDVPGGFAWYYLGHTQHDVLEMIQIADLVGVYGVTALVCAVNALLFEILYAREPFRGLFGPMASAPLGKKSLLIQGMSVGVLLLLALGYGHWQLHRDTMTPGPRLAMLQGNVDQRIRTAASSPDEQRREKALNQTSKHYAVLASLAVSHRPDLVIWPETSYPGTWGELEPGLPNHSSRKLATDMMRVLHTPVLVGMNAVVGGEDRKLRQYNSAILLGRDARWLGRYDKIHRVPFGEYIPFRNTFPVLKRLAPYDYEYSVEPGEVFTRFELSCPSGEYTFGVVICYEDTDPAMARPYARGSPVDFLVNISNDGWFDGSSEHEEHLALCRFRAIETRRGVARSVNMGISALIDPCGRVLAPKTRYDEANETHVWMIPENAGALPVNRWAEFKKVSGVLVGTMPVDSRPSLYAWWGDVFAGGCLLFTLGLVIRVWRRKEQP